MRVLFKALIPAAVAVVLGAGVASPALAATAKPDSCPVQVYYNTTLNGSSSRPMGIIFTSGPSSGNVTMSSTT